MANIMIQGTTSSAGKSFITTALCRIFKEDGYRVSPFKSQNMSSKYYKTKEGYKISISQALQARAAGTNPNPNMNPILLIPSSDKGSQVVIRGKDYKNMEAREYFTFKDSLKAIIREAYHSLEEDYDIIVLEGAGSPAEINLKEKDIVNMGMAKMVDAPVLLVADIDRGGVFASLYGTVMLLEEEERKRIKGLIINKFRGDKSLLDPGLEMIEELLNIPVVGTIPFTPLEGLEDIREADKVEEDLNKLSKLIRENLDMDYVYSLLKLDR